jgi:hypothetical protein
MLFASTVHEVPLQVNEPKSSAASSFALIVEPNKPSPSVEVATHRVEVPVERRTYPLMPALFAESRSLPVIRRLVVVAVFETMRLVVEAVPVAVNPENVAVPENAGEPEKTLRRVPVSSLSAPVKFPEVNDPKSVALPVEVMCPVRLALVVTEPAVKPEAVPVILVPTSAEGVPKFGVTKMGFVAKTATPVPVSSVREFKRVAESAVVVARD